jgi:uncharacterized protein with HEPN domain
MPSDSLKFALYDIRDNILLAQRFVEDLTFEAFKQSRLHFYATTRALEIVSEASRRLPDEMRDRHPQLPWRAIRDAGNSIDISMITCWRPLFGKPCTSTFRHCSRSFLLKSR